MDDRRWLTRQAIVHRPSSIVHRLSSIVLGYLTIYNQQHQAHMVKFHHD